MMGSAKAGGWKIFSPVRGRGATKYGGMDVKTHNCTLGRKIYPAKGLTKAAVIAYNLTLQGCPCMGKALNQPPIPGIQQEE